MASLVLVRHGQSQWNEKNIFTGWKNPDLTSKGEREAIAAGIRARTDQRRGGRRNGPTRRKSADHYENGPATNQFAKPRRRRG